MFAVNLGDVARDSITGFAGVVISEHLYLNGCRRLALQPQELHEGKLIEAQVFDDTQLVVTKAGKFAFKKPEPTGGPEITPTLPAIPSR